MYIEINIETFSNKKNYCAKEIYNELLCVFVAQIIEHAKRMHSILLSSIT
jgi:hypothetical protein